MYSIGVDIGGTFTDIVMVDERDGRTWLAKVPSTPPSFADGFMHGLREITSASGALPAEVRRLIHGTTVGTNAILERKGARLGILATEGFSDILVIGKANRREMYDLFMDPNEPLFLAPRRRIQSVPERIDPTGSVVRPIDLDSVRTAVQRLVDEHQIEALVICFLHSYVNSEHERLAKELVQSEWPDLAISVSSEIDPHFRECERLIVTAFDAYIRPPVTSYLLELESALQMAGWVAPLQVMQSRGGITGVENSIERPVGTILSGPAAGVVGAASAAAASGHGDCLTFDMGGTSADVALVRDGRPDVAPISEVDIFPLRVPMVDIKSVGAGGGSIAWLDDAGGLKVGPRSAGARPGPACYGFGGTEPTVTDAAVVLGYLNPESFAGGLVLAPDLAERAVADRVGEPLRLATADAALGIHRIINSRMAQTLRLISIERGLDPRDFSLVAFGGAGPVHATRLAAEIGIRRVIIPTAPGVYCALGLLGAPVEHGASRTFHHPCDGVDLEALNRTLELLDDECDRLMSRDGISAEDGTRRHAAEMRYIGQSHELEVEFESPLTIDRLLGAVGRFHQVHRQIFAYAKETEEVEFVTLRTVRSKAVEAPALAPPGSASGDLEPSLYRRACFSRDDGFVDTPVYRREFLTSGAAITGPAIVEQPDSTTVIHPGDSALVDSIGNLLIDVPATWESSR